MLTLAACPSPTPPPDAAADAAAPDAARCPVLAADTPFDGGGGVGNSFVFNSFVFNGNPATLVTAPLTADALTANASFAAAVATNTAARQFMKYLTECALPADRTIVLPPGGDELTFHGGLGLAPEWADGPCNEACQEWVSACMLARANAYGVRVIIDLHGQHPALRSDPAERAAAPVEEGAFFGNLFTDPPHEYSCRGRGYDPIYSTFRVCSQPGDRCGIAYVGACGAVDGDTGAPSARHACEGYDPASATYASCHNRASDPGATTFPAPNRAYTRIVTVYLRRSGLNDGCDTPGPDAGIEHDAGTVPDEGPTVAGRTCLNDDDCPAEPLVCDARGPYRPNCTASCTESTDRAAEEAQCGGTGSTCLTFGDGAGARSLCTRACVTTAPAGDPNACPRGRVCTGFWYSHNGAAPDQTGCATFCQDDTDCSRGAACNPRTGACGDPVDMTLLPDGEPCEVHTGPGPAPPSVCRGVCAPLGSHPGEGVCATLLDLSRTRTCPDRPDRIRVVGTRTRDNIGICALMACTGDADCTAPLRCLPNGSGSSICNYPAM